jgi:hypothetical protein
MMLLLFCFACAGDSAGPYQSGSVARWRKTRRMIFPVAVIGSSSTKAMRRGYS